MKIDHLELIRSQEYREVVADRIAALPKGAISGVTILHEHDDSCCRRELWLVSCSRLMEVVSERRSVSSVIVAVKPGARTDVGADKLSWDPKLTRHGSDPT